MKKMFYYSCSELYTEGVPKVWYTLADDSGIEPDETEKNPWNGDEAITVGKYYFLDDCVILIRPAQSKHCQKPGQYYPGEYYKGYYFFEISNQDGDIVHSSRKLYKWDEVISLASLFKGTSFTAAQRIWKSKKL